LFVNAVGLIMLFIKISSNIVGENDNSKSWIIENLLMFGKLNNGLKAITPANGRLGFYYKNAKTSKHPNP
jgi:hypothetical protein